MSRGITHAAVGSGWLYSSMVIDIRSRRVIGPRACGPRAADSDPEPFERPDPLVLAT
ncbi:hypothetical protein ABT275_34065 [Streptomyces sp. NPDC001185]|uniref:hypothetical protein n=1 Tax=Streptomyces sp. NPDC001185 TaxID=3154380 RepID=UPI003326ED50